MYRLYLVLYERHEPPTDEEVKIASGAKPLDSATADSYLKTLEKVSLSIADAFARQSASAKVSNIIFSSYVSTC
jgi:hypothetical protein